MEFLLNVCWLAVSVVAFGYWRATRDPRRKASDSRTAIEAVALTCALILLFYPMSLTDDLHPEIFVVSDSSSQRKHFLTAANAGSPDRTQTPSILLYLAANQRPMFSPGIQLSGITTGPVVHSRFSSSAPAKGRAPPEPFI